MAFYPMQIALPIRLIFPLAMCICFFSPSFSREKQDSTNYKHIVKLDLVSLYDVFFDSRYQLRAGIEYERILSKKSSSVFYLDAGIYDKYDFIKYYDFFGTGMYSVRQKTSIAGFHFLPGYNYNFFRFKNNLSGKLFAGVIADFSYYDKKNLTLNTSTSVESADRYNQIKLGIGLGIGYKNSFCKHFFYELKTSMLAKLYNHVSEVGRNSIRALDAQWTSSNYDFWWVSNFKIGYAF